MLKFKVSIHVIDWNKWILCVCFNIDDEIGLCYEFSKSQFFMSKTHADNLKPKLHILRPVNCMVYFYNWSHCLFMPLSMKYISILCVSLIQAYISREKNADILTSNCTFENLLDHDTLFITDQFNWLWNDSILWVSIITHFIKSACGYFKRKLHIENQAIFMINFC